MSGQAAGRIYLLEHLRHYYAWEVSRKCKFQSVWLVKQQYKGWLRKESRDIHSAPCRACQKTSKVVTMGKLALSSHAKSGGHKAAVKDQVAGPVLHEAAQQLSWLLGRWESEKAEGFYPTIKPFNYREILEFSHIGQPMLNFGSEAFDPDDKPLHRESGFLRVNVGTNHVAYISAQNIGIVEIEEGKVNGTEIQLESTAISSTSFSTLPKTTKLSRTFKLINESTLEQSVSMATSKTPDLVPHLNVRYKKVK